MLGTSRSSGDGRGRSILSLGTYNIHIYTLYGHNFNRYCFATDGGGPRGTSQLKILLEIIHRMEYERERNTDQGLDQIARPCECFDMIGGSGTGGCVRLPFNDS
jgi:patatin-like phospholipase/acyl hydrolase